VTALRALLYGLSGGWKIFSQAGVFYLATLLLGSLALAPFEAGFRAVLDGAPAASELARGEGLDLLAELSVAQPGLFASVLGATPWVALIAGVLALLLLGGAYAAARDEEVPLRESFPAGSARNALPFSALALLNLLPALVYAGAAAGVFAGILGASGETADPGPGWRATLWGVGAGVFLLHHLRTSIGYGQAFWTLWGGRLGLLRCAWGGFLFTWRRFVPVVLTTWSLNALRASAVAVPLLLGPGYSSEGRWLASSLLWQAAFFALAYLRVAEVRMQVEYASEAALPG
jgi:hypothetical protein